MRKRLWTTSEAATQIASENSEREGRRERGEGWRMERMNLKDFASFTLTLFLSAPLQLPSQSTPTHFSSLTEALQPFDL